MAFQQGLSGLNAAAKALDVISNNVSNSSNIGFKQSGTQFNDVYAAALNGAAAGVQIGIGTSIGAVAQLFSQGNITPTNNPLDIAINGQGFFRLNSGGTVAYTRNGQFDLDKSGYIVNSQGYRLTGYPANATGGILPASPSDITVDTSDLQPMETTDLRIGLNLDSRQVPPTLPFDVADNTTYNYSTSQTLFDSLGNPHVMTSYFRIVSGGNWDMYSSIDGNPPALVGASPSLQFNSAGALTTPMPINITGLAVTTGASSPIGGAAGIELNLNGSTQYGSTSGVNRQVQDGYASGRLSGITVSQDGTIQGRYSNGQSRNLGQVVLANFSSPNGLISLGGNFWAESPTSGQALIGAPATGSLGQLAAGSVEESNVDLTAELVNMITAQRNYQANAQSIKTQDQVMQTIVNLR